IIGRNINLRTGIDFEYYRSKLWKDAYDVVSLTQLELDQAKVDMFLKESKLDDLKDEMLGILDDNFDDEIKSLLKGASLAKIRKILS
ncbi:MAG: hypothetical protein ABIH29_03435, partial [Candidatus Micrarchaeota archaeon]